MSYEVVNTIVFYKNGKITVNSADDNIRPLSYRTWEYEDNDSVGLEEKRRLIFNDLIQGHLRFNTRSTNRTHYAFVEVYIFLKKKYGYRPTDLWYAGTPNSTINITKHEAHSIRQEMYRIFKRALQSNVDITSKLYGVKLKNDFWFKNEYKYSYRKSLGSPRKFPLVQAKLYADFYDGEVVGLVENKEGK